MNPRLLAVCLVACGCAPGRCEEDLLKRLQTEAVASNESDWGRWGPNPDSYSSWKTHTNRLIPVYTFGMDLSEVAGERSVYRDEQRLRALYGRLPEQTLNLDADYFDQTDVYELQRAAADAGKRCIVLFVFDGMDWQTTQAAAIYRSRSVSYRDGRGTGLAIQDYSAAPTDFGWFVAAPHNNGTRVNVDAQRTRNPGGDVSGGYSMEIAGDAPWSTAVDALYLIGKGDLRHAYPDSAATATALCSGVKTYNNSVNVDAYGRPATPIARSLQRDGFAVGVVTSVPISHATPACAYANNVTRHDYQDITRDLLGLPSIAHPAPLPGVDVLIGAGWGETRPDDGGQGANFVPGNRYLAADDRDRLAEGDCVVVERTPGAAGASILGDAAAQAIAEDKRLFGFFGIAGGHLPYATADGGYDPAPSVGAAAEVYSPEDLHENPKLPQMATAALDVLSARSDRLWLMVEPGDVDWANHDNNLDNSIGAVISGDEAFLAVAAWIEENVGWGRRRGDRDRRSRPLLGVGATGGLDRGGRHAVEGGQPTFLSTADVACERLST